MMGFEPARQRQANVAPASPARLPATRAAPIGRGGAQMGAPPLAAHNFGQVGIHPAPHGVIQPKLAVNTPSDIYEQEADRIADRIGGGIAAPLPPPAADVQRRALDAPALSAGAGLAELPASSPGRPLDQDTRQFFETRLGHDFGGARVHTDPAAAQSAHAIHARAYTAGRDIYFGGGQYSPGTATGNRLMAHELVHYVQQNAAASENMAAAPPALVQRAPDDPSGGGGAAAMPYPEEQDVIRYAVGARDLGKLAAGAPLYQAKYWKAVGLAADAFYVGPFSSDMGNIYYVYHITGADDKTGVYTLARATTSTGWTDKDVTGALAGVKGGQPLQFKGTALIPPTGGAVAKDPAKTPAPASGGGQPAEAAKTPQEAQPDELTPQRKKWLTAGRENMKHQINSLFNEIQKVKAARIVTWEKNANIKDPKPIRTALEVSLAIVSNGLGGAVGMFLTEALARGLAQEFAKQALKTATTQLTDAIYKRAVEPGRAFLAGATQQALQENRDGNAAAALATKSTLLDCYVEATTLQTISEEHVQTREFNANVDKQYTDDLALADFLLVLEKLWDTLFKNPSVFLRELSEGVIRLQDEVYVSEKAKAYGGNVERLLREDPHIHETDERNGNLLMLPPYGSIGKWSNPNYSFDAFHALATGVNNATLATLSGTPIKDLPLTLTFRFWGDNPYSGLFTDVLCKVWFARRPNGDIWVDFDESGPGQSVDDGIEWLASYGSGISRELTDEERHKYAPTGARKVYEHVKDKPVQNLSNSDIF